MDFAAMFIKLITKNGLVAAFIIIGITTWIAYKIGGLTKGRIHGSAIAIFFGLILAYIGGVVGGGHKGLASIPMFAGVGVMGGAMFRDFAIVSTAFGADLREIKKSWSCRCAFAYFWLIDFLGSRCGCGLCHGLY